MNLSYDPKPSPKYPHGYWYAVTDSGSHDADGPDALSVVAALCEELERAVNNHG